MHLRTLTDPLSAESFLLSMAAAAERHGVSIMPCMSNPNVLLHAAMTPAITHGRASPDSHPNTQNFVGFSGAATWLWAVGVWPFKDVFYTNTSGAAGAGNVPNAGADQGQQEDQPWTHAVVAALSGGGVAPGDVVGGSDAALIMQTCRTDGTLLKPTTPATYIDRTWQTLFTLPDKGGAGAGWAGLGETASADVVVAGLLYKIFYVLPPTAAATIEPRDVGLSASDSHVVYSQAKYGGQVRSVRRFGQGAAAVQVVTRACKGPKQCDKAQLFIAAPILSNRWAVLGETTKIVAVSTQRIEGITAFTGGSVDGDSGGDGGGDGGAAVEVSLIGTAGEVVEMAFMNPAGAVIAVSCAVGTSGRVRMLAGGAAGEPACQQI